MSKEKCPHCKKHIEELYVYSECWQKYNFEDQSYGAVEEVLDFLAYKCPLCGEEIEESDFNL